MAREWRRDRVRVGDATLAVSRSGRGRPLYWCHGVTSSAAQEIASGVAPWVGLSDADWEVLLIDARGHGESSVETDAGALRWPELADDVVRVIDALGHGRVVIGGLSMGVSVALHAAVLTPDRFDALVLMIPPAAWDARSAEAGRYEADARLAEREGYRALAKRQAERGQIPMFEGLFDPLEAALKRLGSIDPRALPAILRGAAASDLPEPELLTRLRHPSLVLAWEGDEGHPLDTARRLAELLPNARLEIARELGELATWSALLAELCAER